MSFDSKEKLLKMLDNSNLKTESKDLVSQFFSSIENHSQYDKIIDLLNRFPSLFDSFCLCFEFKKEMLINKEEKKWTEIMEQEKKLLEK